MKSNKQIVRDFFTEVRSGRHPEQSHRFFAPTVVAHQIQSENAVVLARTPADYAEHVREMTQSFGVFELTVDELIAEADRVYVRWTQVGRHLGEVDGAAPTGAPVVQVASAVYRLENGRIAEYWIQIDRHGLADQLRGRHD